MDIWNEIWFRISCSFLYLNFTCTFSGSKVGRFIAACIRASVVQSSSGRQDRLFSADPPRFAWSLGGEERDNKTTGQILRLQEKIMSFCLQCTNDMSKISLSHMKIPQGQYCSWINLRLLRASVWRSGGKMPFLISSPLKVENLRWDSTPLNSSLCLHRWKKNT